MYECWVYADEPKVRLVVRTGALLPTELGHKDWVLLGPWDAAPETAHAVDHRGFHFFQADEALPPSAFDKAAAAGN